MKHVDVKEEISTLQANAGSLTSFNTQSQEIYKYLQQIAVADQNNVKTYGA